MCLGPERPGNLQGSSPFGGESHCLDAPVGLWNTLGHTLPLQKAEAARQGGLVDGERVLELPQVRPAYAGGCGQVIDLRARHSRGRGIPRFIHGHHNRRGHWLMLQLRQAGYLTVSDVAKTLGIGTTTLRRREGTVYPRAARIGGIRVYREADVELLRCRDQVFDVHLDLARDTD